MSALQIAHPMVLEKIQDAHKRRLGAAGLQVCGAAVPCGPRAPAWRLRAFDLEVASLKWMGILGTWAAWPHHAGQSRSETVRVKVNVQPSGVSRVRANSA
jgi:hypothetical protein